MKSKASLKARLADYSQGACAQLKRPGNAASFKNWVSYSAAAASALATVTAADAGIIYSGVRNIVTGPHLDGYMAPPGLVDIDGDGIVEFQIIGYETGSYGVGRIRAPLSKTGINAIFVDVPDGDAVRFSMGQSLGTIASMGSFKRLVRLAAQTTGGKQYGNFQNSTMGFVGFRFDPGDGDHYGWIRLHLQDLGSDKNGLTDTVTVVDWAYESNINTPIITGDTGISVPEPSSLTIVGLAMGCAALPALRRRRQLQKAAARQTKE